MVLLYIFPMVVVATEFTSNPASMRVSNVHEIQEDEMILDLGPSGGSLRGCFKDMPYSGLEWPLEPLNLSFDKATVNLARM